MGNQGNERLRFFNHAILFVFEIEKSKNETTLMNCKRLILFFLFNNLLIGFVYSQSPVISYQALILQPESQIHTFH